MGVAILDPFALDFDREGGFVTRPFRPRIMMDMAVLTSTVQPLSEVGLAFLDRLNAALAPYEAVP